MRLGYHISLDSREKKIIATLSPTFPIRRNRPGNTGAQQTVPHTSVISVVECLVLSRQGDGCRIEAQTVDRSRSEVRGAGYSRDPRSTRKKTLGVRELWERL
ncbi:hypothetical protein RRG08_048748 [Elysia crispata]|uniref:Uncharacterized protein n=1 Tax=Elysia crispata TaxID=231223 RepID=A0AAE1D7B8_9GAST|nr:hypothetical protein RRG08_048748 [Elysia crispata]